MEIVAELDRLLLLEVGRGEDRDGGSVAKPGQPEDLAAQQSAPAAERFRAGVLDVEVGVGRSPLNRDVADDIAGNRARRPQGQAHRVAGEIARQQQVTLGFVAIEHRLLGQLVEIAGDHQFGAGGVAAHPHLSEMRHQDLESHSPFGDALLGHLDRRYVPGVPQDRRRPVADFAHDRDGHIAANIGRVGGRELRRGKAAKPVELDCTQGQPDRLIFGAVESAGRALDSALDFEWGRPAGGGGVTGRVTSSRVGGRMSLALWAAALTGQAKTADVSKNPKAARRDRRRRTVRKQQLSCTGAPPPPFEFSESNSKNVGIRAIYPLVGNIILTSFIISDRHSCPEKGF